MAPGIFEKVRCWFAKHLVTPLREMTWIERALLISFGFWFGVFPIPGLSTTLLLLSFLFVNRYLEHPITVPESTVATAINVISTPVCIALLPFWMYIGTLIFRPETRCKASVIVDMFNTDGFWVALSKFAGCLGAAACTWLIASAIVIPAILIMRAKIKRGRSPAPGQAYGEFVVLEEEGRSNFSEEYNNGEPGEMQSLSSRSRASSRGNV